MRRIRHADPRRICQKRFHCDFRRNDVAVCGFQHCQCVKNFGKRGYAQYSGVILNSRKVENEEALVKEALKEIGGEIVSVLPRSESVQEAENLGKTVIEALPESAMADEYRKLAAHMIELSAEVENNYE